MIATDVASRGLDIKGARKNAAGGLGSAEGLTLTGAELLESVVSKRVPMVIYRNAPLEGQYNFF